MDRQQKIAIVLLPILAFSLLAGGSFWKLQAAPAAPTYADGVYEGVGDGYYGEIKVAVTIADGKMEGVKILAMDETPGLGDDAAYKTIDDIIAAQSTAVDTVSGATFSSQGTIDAINNALAEASKGTTFTDGTYTGTDADGFYGKIDVTVTVENNKIASITFSTENADEGISQATFDEIIEKYTTRQSLLETGVDTVSGATFTADAFIRAINQALSQAQ